MNKRHYLINYKNRKLLEDNIHDERVKGGGINKKLEEFSLLPESSEELFIKKMGKSKYEENQPPCGCYEKSEAETMKNGLRCINTPCTSIDCLIRKLKETQDFVNSLDKITGMQGLGLMDPAESPYFNRNNRSLDTTCIEKRSSLLDKQKQSNSIVKNHKTIQNNQEFAVKSNKELRSMSINKLQKDEKIKKKDNESVQMKMDKMKSGSLNMVKSEDKFSQYPELSCSSKLSSKTIKKTKTQSNKIEILRKHPKKMYRSQSHDLRTNYVQISKKIMKLVNSTKSRFFHGHKSCIDVRMRVPGNMGWLWNTRETLGKLKPQVGWKPGAISRNVWNLLEDAKVERTSEEIKDRPLTPNREKRTKETKRKHLLSSSRHYWDHRVRDDEHQLPPTLHIHRKKGDYYVTFYPINKQLINKPEEQQEIKPLYFHIRKHKYHDLSGDSSSTASDMEFEFSPPAAVTKYQKKVDTRDVDTLVHQNDIIESIKEVFPEIQLIKKKKKKKSK